MVETSQFMYFKVVSRVQNLGMDFVLKQGRIGEMRKVNPYFRALARHDTAYLEAGVNQQLYYCKMV
jgi:hypothetical protein